MIPADDACPMRLVEEAALSLEWPNNHPYFFLGGLIMMWAPAVPGDINQGALSLDFVDNPVDWGVAKGT